MKIQKTRGICLALVMAASAGHCLADNYSEPGDSGVTAASAQILPAFIDSVTGNLQPGTTDPFGVDPVDVDVYCFTLDRPVNGASIQVFAPTFDSNLLLLREGFFGIWGDDDGGSGLADSGIVTDLPAGTYYIAVGKNNIGAYPATATMTGDEAWDNGDGQLNPITAAIPINFIGGNDGSPDATVNDPYRVEFNFSTSVTGIDQSAGRNYSNLKGDDIVNNSGRGQLTRAKGTTKAQFKVRTQVTGAERRVKTNLRGSAARAEIKIIAITDGGRRNVTAELKGRGYRKTVASGGTIAYKIRIDRGNAPKINKKLVLRSLDLNARQYSDSAGAKVKLKG